MVCIWRVIVHSFRKRSRAAGFADTAPARFCARSTGTCSPQQLADQLLQRAEHIRVVRATRRASAGYYPLPEGCSPPPALALELNAVRRSTSVELEAVAAARTQAEASSLRTACFWLHFSAVIVPLMLHGSASGWMPLWCCHVASRVIFPCYAVEGSCVWASARVSARVPPLSADCSTTLIHIVTDSMPHPVSCPCRWRA